MHMHMPMPMHMHMHMRPPLSPIIAARSEPARSTRLNLESLSAAAASLSPTAPSAEARRGEAPAASGMVATVCSTTTVKMACERDDTSF